MTQYIMTTDKNGKARYYKVVDGKKKVVSKAEYEANTAVVEETVEVAAAVETAEAVESTETTEAEAAETTETIAKDESKTVEEIALAIVKSIIEATGSKHSDKIRLQVKKNCVLINYRNCMVCSLVFGENHSAKSLKFMGDTLETRKQASVYEYGDLNSHKEEIEKQVSFIDWWYANPTKKTA